MNCFHQTITLVPDTSFCPASCWCWSQCTRGIIFLRTGADGSCRSQCQNELAHSFHAFVGYLKLGNQKLAILCRSKILVMSPTPRKAPQTHSALWADYVREDEIVFVPLSPTASAHNTLSRLQKVPQSYCELVTSAKTRLFSFLRDFSSGRPPGISHHTTLVTCAGPPAQD